MLRGPTKITLDAKGRLAIPTKYRDRIAARCDGQMICTVDHRRCLLIYPLPDWEDTERRYQALCELYDGILNVDIHDALGRRVRRLLIERALSDGDEVDLAWDGKDGEGRLVDAGVYIARVEILFNERRSIPLAVLR